MQKEDKSNQLLSIQSKGQNFQFKLESLAPTELSDNGRIYIEGLRAAIANHDNTNIGVTGIYGAGKSTAIASYLRCSGGEIKPLSISLGSFDGDKKPEPKDIELRILQQILYSAASDELPYSRFRRIQTPKKAKRKAFITTYFLATVFYLNSTWKSLGSINFGSFEFLFLFTIICSLFAIGGISLSLIYPLLIRNPLTKVSLKNMEFEAANTETSILNKYMDELLYFFESTDFNTVIFEDLDRFGDQVIFSKLREINTLLNNNRAINRKKKVTFIYALKDSMFSGNERTKFFGNIIPIVPVVNLKNSVSIIEKRLSDFEKNGYFADKQFLFSISQYLNDARQIHNIFNETIFYLKALNDETKDITRLLAVMLYKNTFVADFERTHTGHSIIDRLINRKDQMIASLIEEAQKELLAAERKLKLAEGENFHSKQAFFDSLALEIIRPVEPHNFADILYTPKGSHQQISMTDISSGNDVVNKLTGARNIVIRVRSGQHQQLTESGLSKKITKVTGGLTIEEKLMSIDSAGVAKNNKLNTIIHKSRTIIDSANKKTLKQLLLDVPEVLESEIENLVRLDNIDAGYVKHDDEVIDYTVPSIGLLRYLLRSGYLGEDYSFYTSIFYEKESWTKNDQKFFKSVIEGNAISPSSPVTNPNQVIKYLAEANYHTRPIINYDFVSYLHRTNSAYLKDVVEVLKEVVDSEEHYGDFIEAIVGWKAGQERKVSADSFLTTLFHFWPEYLELCFGKNTATDRGAMILNIVKPESYADLKEAIHVISCLRVSLWDFIASMKDKSSIENLCKTIETLNVTVKELKFSEKEEFSQIFSFVTDHFRFDINCKNAHIFLVSKGFSDLEAKRSTLFSLLQVGSNDLVEFFLKDPHIYADRVMFACEDNRNEPEEAIEKLLEHPDVDIELASKVFQYQFTNIKNIQNFDSKFYLTLAQSGRLLASWKNLELLQTHLDDETLGEYLESATWISSHELTQGSASQDLFWRLVSLDTLSNKLYVRLLETQGTRLSSYPENVSASKWLAITLAGFMRLTSETLESAISHEEEELLRHLVLTNEDAFIEWQDNIEFSQMLEFELLGSFNSPEAKQKLLDQIDPKHIHEVDGLPERVYSVLTENNLKPTGEMVVSLVNSIQELEKTKLLVETKESVLNEDEMSEIALLLSSNLNERAFMNLISKMHRSEISKISEYGSRPTITQTYQNIELAKTLEKRRFIGSFRTNENGIRINTKRKRIF